MTNPPLTINELIESARIHFDNLQADIRNASTRIEHIRLTTLAQEAGHLLTKLERFAEQKTHPDPDPQLSMNELLTNGAAIALPVTSGDKNSHVITRAVAGGCCGGSNSCVCG